MDFQQNYNKNWEVKSGYRSIDLACDLNMMNGGLKIKINLTHVYPVEYYGKPGTYGTNRFTITLHLIRGKTAASFPKFCDGHFFPDVSFQSNGDALSFDLPANDVFDAPHTLTDTMAFFLPQLPKITALAEYLQAQEPPY